MVSFLVFVFVTSITPGPSNLFILNSTKAYGIAGAMKFISGILLGFSFLAVISIICLLVFDSFILKIEALLKYFGFLYLLYLAYKTYASTRKEEKEKVYFSFKSGFLLQILNMKSLLFFITLLGVFILPIANMKFMIFIYMFLTVLIGWLCLFFGGVAGNYLKSFLQKYDFQFKIVMSLLLLYSAISIFL